MTSLARLYAACLALAAFATGYALATGDVGLAIVCAVTAGCCLVWLSVEIHESHRRMLRHLDDVGHRMLSDGLWVVDGDG